MADFIPSGYVTIEQAVDRIGKGLMPHDWLGHETDLLRRDSSVTEAGAAAGTRATTTKTQAGRLNRAVNHLRRVLRAGDVKAVVARDDGEVHGFPPSLWAKPEVRAVFRSGELPVEFRVALEGHKAGAGKRWILISDLELRRVLKSMAERQALFDTEAELRTWLTTKVDEAAGKAPPTKKRMWTEAQEALGSALSYRTFDRVWHTTAPETWRRPAQARRRTRPAQ